MSPNKQEKRPAQETVKGVFCIIVVKQKVSAFGYKDNKIIWKIMKSPIEICLIYGILYP